MKAAFLLPDRGVVKVTGSDGPRLSQRSRHHGRDVCCPGLGRFGALLTPQGKITTDFLITEAPAGHGGGFLLDCPLVPRKLSPRSLVSTGCGQSERRKSVREPRVLAAWDGDPALKPDLAFADPRNAALGWADSCPRGACAKGRRPDRGGNGR